MPNGSGASVTETEDEIRFHKGANWIPENVKTLMRWIHISAIYIDILGESTKLYKRILRNSTVINLILSSLASTITISQYSDVSKNYPSLDWVIKGLVTLSTIIITLNAGYLKVYNIQEKVEKSIRLQQQWINFGTTLSSELQLPVEHRKDALYFIFKLKDTYATLIKQHIVANRHILKKIAMKNGVSADVLTLSDLLERSIQSEAARIEEDDVKGGSQALQDVLRGAISAKTSNGDTVVNVGGGSSESSSSSSDKESDDEASQQAPQKKFVPNALKLLQARTMLRKVSKPDVLTSPRTSISNYVLSPTSVRTQPRATSNRHLPTIDEDSASEASSVRSVRSVQDVSLSQKNLFVQGSQSQSRIEI